MAALPSEVIDLIAGSWRMPCGCRGTVFRCFGQNPEEQLALVRHEVAKQGYLVVMAGWMPSWLGGEEDEGGYEVRTSLPAEESDSDGSDSDGYHLSDTSSD